jgi:hypothetical protein
MRRLLVPVLLLVVGLSVVGFGQLRATTDTVKCGISVMRHGDRCAHTGASHTNSYEEELAGKRRGGRFFQGVGGVVVLVGGLLLYRRTGGATWARRRRDRARSSISAQHGWTYQPKVPGLLESWRPGPLGSREDTTGWHVVRGVANDREFLAFDFRRPPQMSACVVRLPFEAPEVRVVKKSKKSFLLWPAPRGEDARVTTGDAQFDSEYAVLTNVPAAARSLLTADVIAQVQAQQLTFAIDGSWLVTLDRARGARQDKATLAGRIAVTTQFAALLRPVAWEPPPSLAELAAQALQQRPEFDFAREMGFFDDPGRR